MATKLVPNDAGKTGTQLSIFDAMITVFGYLKYLNPMRGYRNSQTDINVNPKKQ